MKLFPVKGLQLKVQKGTTGRNANARKLQDGDGLETIQRSRYCVAIRRSRSKSAVHEGAEYNSQEGSKMGTLADQLGGG